MPDNGILTNRSEHLSQQAPEFDGPLSLTDPTIAAAYQAFTAAHDVLEQADDGNDQGECAAAHKAYDALLALKATTIGGVIAQLSAHLRWANDEPNEDYRAVANLVANLAALNGGAVDAKPVDLDDWRYKLAGGQAIVKAMAIAAEAGQLREMPDETVWRTLHAAADQIADCLDEFDSDLYALAWQGSK